MSRSCDETKSLKADVLLSNGQGVQQTGFDISDRWTWVQANVTRKNQDDGPPRVDISETVCNMMTVGLQGDKSNVATVQRG